MILFTGEPRSWDNWPISGSGGSGNICSGPVRPVAEAPDPVEAFRIPAWADRILDPSGPRKLGWDCIPDYTRVGRNLAAPDIRGACSLALAVACYLVGQMQLVSGR